MPGRQRLLSRGPSPNHSSPRTITRIFIPSSPPSSDHILGEWTYFGGVPCSWFSVDHSRFPQAPKQSVSGFLSEGCFAADAQKPGLTKYIKHDQPFKQDPPPREREMTSPISPQNHQPFFTHDVRTTTRKRHRCGKRYVFPSELGIFEVLRFEQNINICRKDIVEGVTPRQAVGSLWNRFGGNY